MIPKIKYKTTDTKLKSGFCIVAENITKKSAKATGTSPIGIDIKPPIIIKAV